MGTRYPGSAAVSAATSLIVRTKSSADSTITGAIDGANTQFTLPNVPVAASVEVFLNGVIQRPVTDYSVSGAVVTFADAPLTGDVVTVHYSALV